MGNGPANWIPVEAIKTEQRRGQEMLQVLEQVLLWEWFNIIQTKHDPLYKYFESDTIFFMTPGDWK